MIFSYHFYGTDPPEDSRKPVYERFPSTTPLAQMIYLFQNVGRNDKKSPNRILSDSSHFVQTLGNAQKNFLPKKLFCSSLRAHLLDNIRSESPIPRYQKVQSTVPASCLNGCNGFFRQSQQGAAVGRDTDQQVVIVNRFRSHYIAPVRQMRQNDIEKISSLQPDLKHAVFLSYFFISPMK